MNAQKHSSNFTAARTATVVASFVAALLGGCGSSSEIAATTARPAPAIFHGIVILAPMPLDAAQSGGTGAGNAVIIFCDQSVDNRLVLEPMVEPANCISRPMPRSGAVLQVRVAPPSLAGRAV